MLKRKNKSVYFGTESLSSLVPKIWEVIPDFLKNQASFMTFKRNSNAGLENVLVDFSKDL